METPSDDVLPCVTDVAAVSNTVGAALRGAREQRGDTAKVAVAAGDEYSQWSLYGIAADEAPTRLRPTFLVEYTMALPPAAFE